MAKFIKTYSLIVMSIIGLALASCTEQIDMSARYTLKEHTIESYLASKQEVFSEYYKLLGEVKISGRSESTVLQLVSARGNFTVFAPTNQAIQEYLDTLAAKGIITEPSWEGFSDEHVLDSIRKVIVFNSIIDCGDNQAAYQSSDFPTKGEFALPNMNDRKLIVSYGKMDPDSIYINEKSLVDLKVRDVPAINGYIHQVHSIIAPSNATMADVLKAMADEGSGDYVTIARMISACGLTDTLTKETDEAYEKALEDKDRLVKGTDQKRDYYLAKHPSFGKFGYLPEHRKYGYTLFAETDDVYEQAIGKPAAEITLEDLEQLAATYYPNALVNGKYTDPRNALYQFVTYHLLPMRIPANKLVIHYNEYKYKGGSNPYTIPTWEFYTTMGERRLLKLYQAGPEYSLTGRSNVYVNRFPELDNERQGTLKELSCKPENEGLQVLDKDKRVQNLINGMIYPIQGGILAYDEETRNNFQRNRIRFDVASLFPEWMNNDLRGNTGTNDYNLCVAMPCDNDFSYLEDLEILKGSEFYYLSGRGLNWRNWQGDEINVTGQYEMIFRLPPVPKEGTYEIRYAVQTESANRGMCQVYFGTDKSNLRAMGIPLDLRMGGEQRRTAAGTFASIVGWEADKKLPDGSYDDDYNAEVDKRMRNNGFMKGANNYTHIPGGTEYARTNSNLTRRIIVREYMYPEKTYYLKFKSVLSDKKKEFYMDYLELCAKEVYDNPSTPEDIW